MKLNLNYMLCIHLFLIALENGTDQRDGCCFISQYVYKENEHLVLNGFDSFDQLNFNCSEPVEISI